MKNSRGGRRQGAESPNETKDFSSNTKKEQRETKIYPRLINFVLCMKYH